jgi:NAD/NADP transhydrogenase alpha subunit
VKALAYVYYKEGGVGAEKKATIDDLKYHEAGRVLDALLAQFKGEIIEKVAEPEEEEETKEEK